MQFSEITGNYNGSFYFQTVLNMHAPIGCVWAIETEGERERHLKFCLNLKLCELGDSSFAIKFCGHQKR